VIEAEARGAWKDLEAKLRPFVARRVRGADAEDVLQDVLFRVARGLAGLRDDQRFGPWVYVVARSAIADHQRAAESRMRRDREMLRDALEACRDIARDSRGPSPATFAPTGAS
jgi:RNA polymerase sigma factor (sigma-70 family)